MALPTDKTEFILLNYATMSAKDMAKKLGITKPSVQYEIRFLRRNGFKLVKNRNNVSRKETVDYLKEKFPEMILTK